MQLTVNQPLITRRARIGRLANIGGLGLLIGGFVLSVTYQEYIWVAYSSLIAALILLNVAKVNTLKHGTRPRLDESITSQLKTLDAKHHLYHFVEGLPVDHLLVSPYGLYVLEARPQFGRVAVTGDKWRRGSGITRWLFFLGEGSVGNPARDLRRHLEALRKYLSERLGEATVAEIAIEGAVVFTHPRAALEVNESTVPVLHVRELRGFVRRREGRGRLSADLLRRINEAFDEQAAAEALVPAKA